jgi:uncharacterized protein (TIGR02466 family)
MITQLWSVDAYKVSYPDIQEIIDFRESEFMKSLPVEYYKHVPILNFRTTHPDMDDFIHKTPLFKNLHEFMRKHAKIYWDYLGLQPRVIPEIFESWAHIYNPNIRFEAHSHSMAGITGILYIDSSPAQGRLVLYNPMDLMLDNVQWANRQNAATRTDLMTLNRALEVNTGDLVFIPGWMKHGVEANSTDRPRKIIGSNWR